MMEGGVGSRAVRGKAEERSQGKIYQSMDGPRSANRGRRGERKGVQKAEQGREGQERAWEGITES